VDGTGVDPVLVTGAGGFLGSHLVEDLLARGHDVTAFVRRTSYTEADAPQYIRNLSGCIGHPRLTVAAVDLAGPSAISALADQPARIWYHLAADACVAMSLTQPEAVVQNNVLSTSNVLEAAKRHGDRLRNLVIASSSEVYGSCEAPIDESFPLNPATPYAASKVAGDRLASSYAATFGVPITIARLFNSFGPRQIYDVVPIFIRLAQSSQPLTVHGDGLQSRDLTYVSDTVRALVALGGRTGTGEVFNIGTGEHRSVLEIAETVRASCSSSSPIVHVAPRLGQVHKLQADFGRARTALGWTPAVSFEEGVRRTVTWARGSGASSPK
jgi:nucleoside-diphosphate-sugar epimerase